ncbi:MULTISPECIES: hypothetical protein [Nitrospirillum]|uniref:Uncharacterized protein n=1 Tax=Nitrospirillum amazonense TaxID=28077 RepID=A0A560GDU2_9PROT|nr:hypothetical protein [Nitrospirillum amazonense]MEC4591004.1 hypothetical protein [Nitrospirillum amazonense]TWB32083.1 hypothetical protein FBZ88_101455 [Nitrospirillum amazonense]
MTHPPTPDLSAPPPVAAAPAPTGAPTFTIRAMLILGRRAGRKGE